VGEAGVEAQRGERGEPGAADGGVLLALDVARQDDAPLDPGRAQHLERTLPRGTSGRIYGASKVACEVLLDAYANAYGF
jgi:nucleoside-diphosphate-sugar epimerase